MFDEKEIIYDAVKGNIRAFELLVKQYEKLVFAVLNRMLTNKEDVEDVCQEVFVKVHKGLGSFKFESKFSTWIGRIACLTAINHLKKNNNQGLTGSAEELENIHFTTENPEGITVKKDMAAYINALIEQLPLQYRTVLTLYHINEFSYREIEDATGMPEGTVKGYLFRARKLLKTKLELYLKNERL